MLHRIPHARTLAVFSLSVLAAGCASRTGPRRNLDLQRPPSSLEVVAPEDGTLLSVLDVTVRRPWAAASADARERFDEERWTEAREALEGRADQVTYSSSGLRVGGFIVRPERVAGRRLPVVVLARDGRGDEGLDVDALLVEMEGWAREGYVAVATAYRGSRLSQGSRDSDDGGAADVLALLPLVRSLGYADPARVFLLGRGVGAKRALHALDEAAPFRAVALLDPAAAELELTPQEEGAWPPVLVSCTRAESTDETLTSLLAASKEVETFAAENEAPRSQRERQATDAAAAWFARHGGRTMLN